MGCYAYCKSCDAPLSSPSLAERIKQSGIVCTQCRTVYHLDRRDYETGIDELLERLEALEDRTRLIEEGMISIWRITHDHCP